MLVFFEPGATILALGLAIFEAIAVLATTFRTDRRSGSVLAGRDKPPSFRYVLSSGVVQVVKS